MLKNIIMYLLVWGPYHEGIVCKFLFTMYVSHFKSINYKIHCHIFLQLSSLHNHISWDLGCRQKSTAIHLLRFCALMAGSRVKLNSAIILQS